MREPTTIPMILPIDSPPLESDIGPSVDEFVVDV